MNASIWFILLSCGSICVSGSHVRRREIGFFHDPPPTPSPTPRCSQEQIENLNSKCDCRWKSKDKEWKNENEYIECLVSATKFSPCELQAAVDASNCLPFPWSSHPTELPSSEPTTSNMPTTSLPSATPSSLPSELPSSEPTMSSMPTTSLPSEIPSSLPSEVPSSEPTTSSMPTTSLPSAAPSISNSPSDSPSSSALPTASPTTNPTQNPTGLPTQYPSHFPSMAPSTVAVKQAKQKRLVDFFEIPENDDFFRIIGASPTPAPGPPVNHGHLEVVGNDGLPRGVFPLSACQGDCDSDRECKGRLQCMNRDRYEPVPGCTGSGQRGKDYCVDPFPSRPWSGDDPNYKFRLRLYWQADYFWQETHDETWWCMECTKCDGLTLGDGKEENCESPGDGTRSCREGHNIWIQRCKRSNSDYEFNVIKNAGSGDQIRVAGTNLCFSTVRDKYLELRSCNSRDPKQLWKNIENLSKFELRPYDQSNLPLKKATCLTQMHHPKSREMIGLQPCTRALGHETLYWEEFHRF